MSKEEAGTIINAALCSEVEYRYRDFILNDTIRNQIEAIAEWLTGDSSQFGMLLCGGVGNGKSTLVKAFQQILNQMDLRVEEYGEHWSIQIWDAIQITQLMKNDYAKWDELRKIRMLAIDDLGTELTEVKEYGNIHRPVIDLINHRYDRQLFTIVTTNLKPKEIREKYGDRIADRFNEMMVKIVYKNPSFRDPSNNTENEDS